MSEEASGGDAGADKKRLYVGNIPFHWRESDLLGVFTPFGKVLSARVPQSDQGRSKGFGFVEFEGEEDAARAIAELNEKDCDGRRIRVNVSTPRPRGSDGYSRGRGGGRDRERGDYGGGGGYGGGYGRGDYGGGGGDYRGRGSGGRGQRDDE
jgi:RNA recognition motif-containing protein